MIRVFWKREAGKRQTQLCLVSVLLLGREEVYGDERGNLTSLRQWAWEERGDSRGSDDKIHGSQQHCGDHLYRLRWSESSSFKGDIGRLQILIITFFCNNMSYSK